MTPRSAFIGGFMGTFEMAFGGEIHDTVCECHKGQFVVVVKQFHSELGQRVVGTEIFKSMPDAQANMEKTVMKFAEKILESEGLKIDQASAIKVAHGDDAEQNIRRVLNQNNPNLH